MQNNLGQSRSEIIDQISATPIFDLLVVGGGIHGAITARLAAEAGLKVLLLEQGDYAQGTSSRSSKMAHGGLRYLELFDFEQVFEGVKCRDILYRSYPDLVKPYPFLIPVNSGDLFFRLKLGLGLTLYDLMLSHKALKHSWIKKSEVDALLPELKSHKLSGCFRYFDGIMDDSKLVLCNILQARALEALCLNYAQVENLSNQKDGNVRVRWRNKLDATEQEVLVKSVINAAGPWVGKFCQPALKFSRGSHILFSRRWDGPALFLPMAGKARYYFVWPHSAGTMVGTTEREVEAFELDPQPSQDEVDEILSNLSKDLPDSGLDRSSAHYAFSGIRTLALRGSKGAVPRLSRKHVWLKEAPVFSLLGGKFTTAEWTAQEGLKLIAKHLGRELKKVHPTPKLDSSSLNSSIESAFTMQQAVTLEDYLRRRSGIEYSKGNGLNELENLALQISQYIQSETLKMQMEAYRKRIQQILNLFA